jgi:hypothetical protein
VASFVGVARLVAASLDVVACGSELCPGLGDAAGLRGGLEVVNDDDEFFDGVFGADWSSRGTFNKIVFAFSSWTNLLRQNVNVVGKLHLSILAPFTLECT